MSILDERLGEMAMLEGQRRRDMGELENFVLDPTKTKPVLTVRPVLRRQRAFSGKANAS